MKTFLRLFLSTIKRSLASCVYSRFVLFLLTVGFICHFAASYSAAVATFPMKIASDQIPLVGGFSLPPTWTRYRYYAVILFVAHIVCLILLSGFKITVAADVGEKNWRVFKRLGAMYERLGRLPSIGKLFGPEPILESLALSGAFALERNRTLETIHGVIERNGVYLSHSATFYIAQAIVYTLSGLFLSILMYFYLYYFITSVASSDEKQAEALFNHEL